MKNLFFLLTLLLAFSAIAGNETEKSLMPYRVVSSKEDKTLSKNQVAFDIHFFTGNYTVKVSSAVKMSDNGVQNTIGKDVQGKFSSIVKPGKHKFQFFLSSFHQEVYTDSIAASGGQRITIEVNFQRSDELIMCDKPVLYFYPEKETSVSVKLDLKGNFNFTYPQYKNGWNFTASPDGKLSMNEKKYDYLFWEGSTQLKEEDKNKSEGFMVSKENTVKFLEEQLTAMGLNAREQEDFITYWAPQMVQNEENFVRFLFNEQFDKYAPLSVEPKPDNVFRVFMVWRAVEGERDSGKPKPQKIQKLNRTGFSVVEWGGAHIRSAANTETIK